MAFRRQLAQFALAVLMLVTALLSVGLTASSDSIFSIRVQPVLFGVDIDVKVGSAHTHFSWSAFRLP